MFLELTIRCPRCRSVFRVKAEMAEKPLNCLACPARLRVPRALFEPDERCLFHKATLEMLETIRHLLRPEDWGAAYFALRRIARKNMIGIRHQVRRLMIQEIGKVAAN